MAGERRGGWASVLWKDNQVIEFNTGEKKDFLMGPNNTDENDFDFHLANYFSNALFKDG